MSSILEQAHRTTRKIYGDREFGHYVWNPALHYIQQQKLLSTSILEVAPTLAKLLNKTPRVYSEPSLTATKMLISCLLKTQPYAITASQKFHAFILSNDRTIADRINKMQWEKLAAFIKPTVPKPGREYFEDHFWDAAGIEKVRYIDMSPDAIKKREERKKRRQDYFSWFTALLNAGFAWALIQQQVAECRWALTQTDRGLVFAQFEQSLRHFKPTLDKLQFLKNGTFIYSSINELIDNT